MHNDNSPVRTLSGHLPSATLGSAEDAGGLVIRKLFEQIEELKEENK